MGGNAKRRLTRQEAMGIVFVRVGRAMCIREMYTRERAFNVLAPDLSALYGSEPTAAAAWIDAARKLEAEGHSRSDGAGQDTGSSTV